MAKRPAHKLKGPALCGTPRVRCPCCGMWRWPSLMVAPVPKFAMAMQVAHGGKRGFRLSPYYLSPGSGELGIDGTSRQTAERLGMALVLRLRRVADALERELSVSVRHELRAQAERDEEWQSENDKPVYVPVAHVMQQQVDVVPLGVPEMVLHESAVTVDKSMSW